MGLNQLNKDLLMNRVKNISIKWAFNNLKTVKDNELTNGII